MKILTDKRISWRSKGLWLYLAQTDLEGMSTRKLIEMGKDGSDGVHTSIRELIQYGYLTRIKPREKGKLGQSVWQTHNPE